MALHCMYPSVLPTKFSSKKRTSEYIYMSCKLYCVSWLVKDKENDPQQMRSYRNPQYDCCPHQSECLHQTECPYQFYHGPRYNCCPYQASDVFPHLPRQCFFATVITIIEYNRWPWSCGALAVVKYSFWLVTNMFNHDSQDTQGKKTIGGQ